MAVAFYKHADWEKQAARLWVWPCMVNKGTSKTLYASIYGLLQFITAAFLFGRMEFQCQLDISA
jgi:hypothetical protein